MIFGIWFTYIETARFKWPGHKNEVCFFRNTLFVMDIHMCFLMLGWSKTPRQG